MAYFKNVHLKGYKSIKDTQIEFLRGLNIIIGQNGSGKTNFFGILRRCIENSASPRI
ncbi:MAG: hypothetical protein RI894_1983 [Bacteroidota bacterium]|jgi:AAA15 family ATPase/GTPase